MRVERSFPRVLGALLLLAFLVGLASTVATVPADSAPDNDAHSARGSAPASRRPIPVAPRGPAGDDVPVRTSNPAGQSGEKKYDRNKIFEVIRDRRKGAWQQLTLVAAHRGNWKDYPENSWEAISSAGREFEIVEADIKPASNEPVVFHDLYLNRVTNKDGLLASVTKEEFSSYHLRDRFGATRSYGSGGKPMIFAELLDKYATYLLNEMKAPPSDTGPRPGFVLALDVKGKKDSEAWPLVVKINEQIEAYINNSHSPSSMRALLKNAFLVKIAAQSLPEDPADVEEEIGYWGSIINLCIVVNESDEKPEFGERKKTPERVSAYLGRPYVATYEVVYKHSGDPAIKYILKQKIRTSIGNFLPYYDLPVGHGNSNAMCCSKTNTDTDNQQKYLDYRGRWAWMARQTVPFSDVYGDYTVPMFGIITIDRPDLVSTYLKSIGRRNTAYIEMPAVE